MTPAARRPAPVRLRRVRPARAGVDDQVAQVLDLVQPQVPAPARHRTRAELRPGPDRHEEQRGERDHLHVGQAVGAADLLEVGLHLVDVVARVDQGLAGHGEQDERLRSGRRASLDLVGPGGGGPALEPEEDQRGDDEHRTRDEHGRERDLPEQLCRHPGSIRW
jgi:hypothetical protein